MLPEYRASSECFFGNPIFADPLFCNLPLKILESLARIKRRKRFQKNILIIAGGIKPSRIYVLRTGQALLFLNAEPNNGRIVRLVEPNEILGLTESVANLPYEIRVQTVTSCLYDFIERKDFIRLLKEEREVCFRLAQLLGNHLQKSHYHFRSSVN